ncbi:MAG: ABC transporter ATP-binding protein/permease [Clostridiales bacterium]|nr:ABC transporter ATP-binding protein/permease [Clostridiales bacterium]
MKILLRVAKEAARYKGLLIITAVSTLLLTALNLVAPRLMSDMIALVAAGLGQTELQRIGVLTVWLLSLYLLRILFRYLSSYLAHKAAWHLVKELRVKVYYKLQGLSLDFFRSHESGDLISRTINDTATFEMLYAHLLPESVTNAITVLGVTVILFMINPRLALLTCLPIPFILLSGWIFAKKVRPNFRKAQKSLGILSAQLQDNFSGIQEIQAFGQQKPALEQVERKAADYTDSVLRALKLSAVFHPGVEFLTALGTVIIVGFGGYLAYLGQIAVGDIVAFLLYLTLFFAPITGLSNLLEQMQQALAGAERVIEVLDAPEIVSNQPGALPLENPQGEISFENVSFSYTEGVPVLKDVSFTVRPGEMVALVGATGVGKSTIAQLIARFYDPQEGVIRLDGRALPEIELASLRKSIAMVLQDTFLFNGTIAENIAFARPDTSQEEIEEAARIARIHEDIAAMPDAYETKVGERGAKLSGGQKQRIAIARAVLCRAPVLVLDEATASVDVQTESSIQQSIKEITGTCTIIAIAHRLSTIRRASRILVLKNGKIIQQGTHEELTSQPGLYQEMCMVQEKGENTYI